MLQLGTTPSPVPQAGFIGGYMTPIPTNWRGRLGGNALSGMSGLSGSNTSSYGPAAFSFNPDDIIIAGKKPGGIKPEDMKVHALLYYDISN